MHPDVRRGMRYAAALVLFRLTSLAMGLLLLASVGLVLVQQWPLAIGLWIVIYLLSTLREVVRG